MATKAYLYREAQKDLKRLHKPVFKAVMRAINLLEADPLAGFSLRGELMGKRKYRVGSYRIIYQFLEKEKTILIYKIESRGQVYK